MSRQKNLEKLLEVKKSLAEKYDRLAQARNSAPGKQHMNRKAERYRKQVANLQRLTNASSGS